MSDERVLNHRQTPLLADGTAQHLLLCLIINNKAEEEGVREDSSAGGLSLEEDLPCAKEQKRACYQKQEKKS